MWNQQMAQNSRGNFRKGLVQPQAIVKHFENEPADGGSLFLNTGLPNKQNQSKKKGKEEIQCMQEFACQSSEKSKTV